MQQIRSAPAQAPHPHCFDFDGMVKARLPPPPVARGMAVHEVQPGLSLILTDLHLAEAIAVESRTFPAASLGIVLDGHAKGETRHIETGFGPNEVWIAATGETISTRRILSARRPVRSVSLVVTPAWLELNQARFSDDPSFDDLAEALRRPTQVHRRALDCQLRQIAWSIQNPPCCPVLAALHRESRTLDLLVALVTSFQRERAKPPSARLSARSLERMMALRSQIDCDPAKVRSLGQLAAEFGISGSKLKQDFWAAFGTCPGSYIAERRLELGRTLIARQGLSVSEAAYRAGYNHPASFTAAFRRRYGHPPSAIKG